VIEVGGHIVGKDLFVFFACKCGSKIIYR